MDREKILSAISSEEHRIGEVKRKIDALVIKRENLKKEYDDKLREFDELISTLERSCLSGLDYIESCKNSLGI